MEVNGGVVRWKTISAVLASAAAISAVVTLAHGCIVEPLQRSTAREVSQEEVRKYHELHIETLVEVLRKGQEDLRSYVEKRFDTIERKIERRE